MFPFHSFSRFLTSLLPSQFADLRLRRARKGWKWRLVRIRPNGEVWVQPFIKPSQKPFAERGINSSDSMNPRTSSAELLKKLATQAQWRWRGMPITRVRSQNACMKPLGHFADHTVLYPARRGGGRKAVEAHGHGRRGICQRHYSQGLLSYNSLRS